MGVEPYITASRGILKIVLRHRKGNLNHTNILRVCVCVFSHSCNRFRTKGTWYRVPSFWVHQKHFSGRCTDTGCSSGEVFFFVLLTSSLVHYLHCTIYAPTYVSCPCVRAAGLRVCREPTINVDSPSMTSLSPLTWARGRGDLDGRRVICSVPVGQRDDEERGVSVDKV